MAQADRHKRVRRRRSSSRSSTSPASYLLLFGIALAAMCGSHAHLFDLPYFWDELGQFIPAALDIQRHGWWIPRSTLPNVHPPGVMAYLAGVWTLTGYSVFATRAAMLTIAAAGVVAVFVLAVRLCRNLPGYPAFAAALLLMCAPLFYTQSMMAQLDMPCVLFTSLGLLFFLEGKHLLSAFTCTLLVLVKETGIVVPAVFGIWLLIERRVKDAFLYLLPLAALCAWLGYLQAGTGHVFGNREFTHYNVAFQLHPVRLGLTIVRRFFYVFVDNLHWIGALALFAAWFRTRIFRTREWAVTAVVFGTHLLLVSVFGGAALERYVLPVLPLFYIAVAAAWTTLSIQWRRISMVALPAGLIAALFLPSIFPYPYENNYALVRFVRLHQQAAQFVEDNYRERTIVSAWPFPDALRNPDFGYVTRPMNVRGIDNFNRSTVAAVPPSELDVFVPYSRTWEPQWGAFRLGLTRRFLSRYYLYEPQIAAPEIEKLGLTPVTRWENGGQWIEVWAR